MKICITYDKSPPFKVRSARMAQEKEKTPPHPIPAGEMFKYLDKKYQSIPVDLLFGTTPGYTYEHGELVARPAEDVEYEMKKKERDKENFRDLIEVSVTVDDLKSAVLSWLDDIFVTASMGKGGCNK